MLKGPIMSKPWTHEEFVDSGLTGEIWTEQAMSAWPDVARQHIQGCEACSGHLALDRRIIVLAATQFTSRRAEERTPPLPLEELFRRFRHRDPKVLALHFHTESLSEFPTTRFGSASSALAGGSGGPGALELVRTATGVRAWDPEAFWVSLFQVQTEGDEQVVRWLSSKKSQVAGVALHANIAVRVPTTVMVFSARSVDVDVVMLGWWLEDAAKAGLSREQLSQMACHDRIHAATLVVDPPVRT